MCEDKSSEDLEFSASETVKISEKKDLDSLVNDSPSEKQVNYLLSRKFLAFLITIFVGLGGFLTIYLQTKEGKLYTNYLDFILWSFVAYTGGNTLGKLTDKMEKK